jgi:hypothetical protein
VLGVQLDAGHHRRPGGRLEQGTERPYRRRLACSVGAEEAEHLSVADLERDVVKGDPVPEVLAQAVHDERR